MNRHKKEKHGISTETGQCTEEEAAQILNEMSSRKVYDNETNNTAAPTDREDATDEDGAAHLPKKRRKSLPPRKTVIQVGEVGFRFYDFSVI